MGSITANTQASHHETVRWIGLYIQRESEGKKTYDIHPKLLEVDSHINRSKRQTRFSDPLKIHIDLRGQGGFKFPHRFLADGLSDEPSSYTMLSLVEGVEDASITRSAGKEIDL